MTDTLSITYNYTIDDDVKSNLVHLKRTSRSASRLVFSIILLMFGFPIFLLLSNNEPFFETLENVWPLIAIPLTLIVIVPLLRLRYRKLVFKLLSAGKNIGRFGERTLSLEPRGIRENSESGSIMRFWPSIEKFLVSETHVYLYASAVEVFVIPRHAFLTEFDFHNFINQVTRYTDLQPENI